MAGNPTTLIEDDGHVSEQQREDAKRAAATLYKPGTAAYGHMLGYYLRDPVETGRQLGVDSWVKAKDAESARYLAWHADRQRRHTREAEQRALPHPTLWQRSKQGFMTAGVTVGIAGIEIATAGAATPVIAGGGTLARAGSKVWRWVRSLFRSEPKPTPWGPLGRIESVGVDDPAARALAERIGGQASVRFSGDATGREFDAVSDLFVAQSKPAGFKLGSQFRNQAKATFEAAQATGRKPYFHFEGPPARGLSRSSMSTAVATASTLPSTSNRSGSSRV